MSNALAKRDAHGHLLPGSRLNPGGRPRGVIEAVRERLGPHTPEFVDALVELARSPNEATRLAAIREAFDRLNGQPAVTVDTTDSKLDIGAQIGALYLQAVQAANRSPDAPVVDVQPVEEPAANPMDQADAPAEAESNNTAQW